MKLSLSVVILSFIMIFGAPTKADARFSKITEIVEGAADVISGFFRKSENENIGDIPQVSVTKNLPQTAIIQNYERKIELSDGRTLHISFPSSIAMGNAGENILRKAGDQRYTSERGWQSIDAKYDGIHGFDNIRINKDGRIIIEEHKFTNSRPGRRETAILSDQRIGEIVQEMKNSQDKNIRSAAVSIENSIKKGSLERVIMHLDTRNMRVSSSVVRGDGKTFSWNTLQGSDFVEKELLELCNIGAACEFL